jgi:hypothetical protein
MLLIDAWLCPHCFIGWLERDDGYGPIDRSAGALRIVLGTLFLGSSGLLNSVDVSRKVAMYGDRPQEAYVGRTWTGVGSIHVVLVRFCSVGCISIRIAATLEYE